MLQIKVINSTDSEQNAAKTVHQFLSNMLDRNSHESLELFLENLITLSAQTIEIMLTNNMITCEQLSHLLDLTHGNPDSIHITQPECTTSFILGDHVYEEENNS